jgi:hypothetical protein
MQRLNLPSFDYKLKKAEGKVWIFDVIRKKYIILTPEEWVRQHFLHYLLNELYYPKALTKVEGGLVYNTLSKRSDIVIFDRDAKPWMLVECKSPETKITENTLHQASSYNATLKAKYLTVTNGLMHVCSETNWNEGTTRLLDELPKYG